MSSSTSELSAFDAKDREPAVKLTSKALQSAQWWAALVTVVVPTIAALAAAWWGYEHGFSKHALVAWAVMHLATMVGITVGFHRFAAHRAFDAGPWTGTALVALGSMAAQGPMIHWVSNHRRHHQFSDEEQDVHSPHVHGNSPLQRVRGFWHSHVGWMFSGDMTNPMRYSKDLLKNQTLLRANRLYFAWVVLGLVAPAVIVGLATWSLAIAAETFLLAGLVRVFSVHHATWSINSITHLWGSRPFNSGDRSVNVAWLAVPSAGESWHNCHHAFPGSARFGLAWWQFDVGYVVIWTLEKAGLATAVNRPSAATLERARRKDVRAGQETLSS